MKIRKKIKVEIDAEFGSEFQEEFGLQCLKAMLDGWRFALPGYHKNNKINFFDFVIAYGSHPRKTPPPSQ